MSIGVTFALPTLNRGGAERVLVSLAGKLKEQNFEVSLVVLNGENALGEDVSDGVRLVTLKSGRTSLCAPELARAFRSLAPDLIFSTTHHMNVASIMAAGLAGIRNVALRSPNTPSAERDLGWWTAVAAGWAYRRARHVIAQTEEMKVDLIHRFGVDPRSVKVLRNPLDTELIDRKVAKTGNPFEAGTVNIVTAGRLSLQKGVDLLIRAFGRAAAADSRLRLHVLGRDGGEEQRLRSLALDLAVADKVFFRGEEPNPYPFLKHCDLFVLASRWEGLPNVVLECVHLGTRVVATRTVPALERLIDNGRSGFLVPVDDETALADAILARDTLIAPHPPLPQVDVGAFFADLVRQHGH